VGEDLAALDRSITDALGALRRARASAERATTSTTRWQQDIAERRLDCLLARRSRYGARTPEAVPPGGPPDR
jgi:hypothetical protein